MGILIGIDEAGYGPHLGPLVVAAAAISFSGDAPANPDLWSDLARHVARTPGRARGRVVVGDSKACYAGGGNVATLERTLLGFLRAAGCEPGRLSALLAALAAPASDGPAPADSAPPWDSHDDPPLPVCASADDIADAAARLTEGLAGIGASAAGLWINVASPARFNRLIGGDRNKAGALFAMNAEILAAALDRWPREPMHVTLDRHGGRRYYAGLLAGAFPLTDVRIAAESPAESRYVLARGGPPVRLSVRDRCESWSLATALASMAAKYVRELFMRKLNTYFQARVPDLRPTAGYGRDAWRFLADVAAARAELGVPEACLLRRR
jgi:hypothetical protein